MEYKTNYQGIRITCNGVDISILSKDDITLAVEFIQALRKKC